MIVDGCCVFVASVVGAIAIAGSGAVSWRDVRCRIVVHYEHIRLLLATPRDDWNRSDAGDEHCGYCL